MKSRHSICLIALALLPVLSPAAIFVSSGVVNQSIPDDSNTGVASSIALPDVGVITSLTVDLNLSIGNGQTGWSGDLYAYLQHDSGFSVLLNRPGRSATIPGGYNDNQPFSITFSDSAANGDIHNYRQTLSGNNTTPLSAPLTGIWAPDGRNTDPAFAVVSDSRTALLDRFNGANAGGQWTLFISDLSSDNQYTLGSWAITAETVVPEPAAFPLAAGVLLGGFAIWRRRKAGK